MNLDRQYQNEVDLLNAEVEGLGSQLLDVQQDCVRLKAENERRKRLLARWLSVKMPPLHEPTLRSDTAEELAKAALDEEKNAP